MDGLCVYVCEVVCGKAAYVDDPVGCEFEAVFDWHAVEKAVEKYSRMAWMMPLHSGGRKWGATWSLFSLQMASLVNVDCVLVTVEVVYEAEDSTVNLMM